MVGVSVHWLSGFTKSNVKDNFLDELSVQVWVSDFRSLCSSIKQQCKLHMQFQCIWFPDFLKQVHWLLTAALKWEASA